MNDIFQLVVYFAFAIDLVSISTFQLLLFLNEKEQGDRTAICSDDDKGIDKRHISKHHHIVLVAKRTFCLMKLRFYVLLRLQSYIDLFKTVMVPSIQTLQASITPPKRYCYIETVLP